MSIVHELEMIPRIQLLQANLGMKGIHGLQNNVFNMVRQKSSEEVEERLVCLVESLYNTNLRGKRY